MNHKENEVYSMPSNANSLSERICYQPALTKVSNFGASLWSPH